VLAAQLFFQFIPLYVRPKEATVAARMVRPLPWVVDNVRTVYAPLAKSDKKTPDKVEHDEYSLPQQFDGAAAWYPLQTTPVTTYVLMLPTPLPATQKHVEVPAPHSHALGHNTLLLCTTPIPVFACMEPLWTAHLGVLLVAVSNC